MSSLTINTLGGLSVFRRDKSVVLPPSRRTRALLAYMALTARPHRRDRLCEIFWEMPDDPRGALRWSLSKIRAVVNEEGNERLLADRERVQLETESVDIDLFSVSTELLKPELSTARLRKIANRLREPMLAGLDLKDQVSFQFWLTAERENVRLLLSKALERLSKHTELPPDKALRWTREWLDVQPFDTNAAAQLITQLKQLGETKELNKTTWELTARFSQAGIAWSSADKAGDYKSDNHAGDALEVRQILSQQKIRFCKASDGVRLAYASIGHGKPIVKAANWLSHLELDWDAPIWSPLFRQLAVRHQFIRYDERGNGLSDWTVGELSQEVFVNDLEAVVEASSLERFALLGISQGAAVSIEYAVKYPHRVSHLILFGGYAAGWRLNATAEIIREREAIMTLTQCGWGQDNPAYRQIFSSTFMPHATSDELNWFNEFQRRTTSPDNAVRFLSAFGDIDVRHRLEQVTAPTLVMHSVGDRRIPVQVGRDIAAAIPGAQFLGLESDSHLLLGREPASQEFIAAVLDFIASN
ncbi:MAG: alpha/beta fold hydrolase [Granulosicoccus sp.]